MLEYILLLNSFLSYRRDIPDNRSTTTCLVVSNQFSEKSTGNLARHFANSAWKG